MMETKVNVPATVDCLLNKLPGIVEFGVQFGQGLFAITNKVFPGYWTEQESEKSKPVIIKIALPSVESRENLTQTANGQVGGWLTSRLANEAKLLGVAQSSGIFVPEVLFYDKDASNETELLVLERVKGATCFDLRTRITDSELPELEYEKGKMLGLINRIQVADSMFGPLSEGSRRFSSWQAYFNYKLDTTLLLLDGKYEGLINLEKFSDLVKSGDEWREFLTKIDGLYKSEVVQQLLCKDGDKTITHGDYWDGNLIANKEDANWEVYVIDWERGDIGSKSFDLALWLVWKVGGDLDDPDPLKASADFLKGYQKACGFYTDKIIDYMAIYGLWQYLDFLLLDLNYGIDRSEESVYEIKKLSGALERIVG